jgi:hypothetical protein
MPRTHRSLGAYCATLWWRRLEFSFFLVMEHRWNETDREKPVPVSLCPPQIPHGLTRDRTRSFAVRGRRLTAWAMTRSSSQRTSVCQFRPGRCNKFSFPWGCSVQTNLNLVNTFQNIRRKVIHKELKMKPAFGVNAANNFRLTGKSLWDQELGVWTNYYEKWIFHGSWTREDEDDPTSQSVGNHFPSDAASHPRKPVSSTWKIVFFLVNLRCYAFAYGESKENHKISPHSLNVFDSKPEHGVSSRRATHSNTVFGAPLTDATAMFHAEVWGSEYISGMLAASAPQLTKNRHWRRSWRRGGRWRILRDNNTVIPVQMKACETQMDKETEYTLYPFS